MTEIGQKIIQKIREHAAADPAFIYEAPDSFGSCAYVYEGCPSCLVGRALWDLELIGPNLERDVVEIEDDSSWTSVPNAANSRALLKYLGLKVDASESDWIIRVQTAQDNGTRWGAAVANADIPTGAVV